MEYFLIKDPFIVEVTGKDAVRYLNSRLTQDIKNLSVGDSRIGGALTPQGKTQALFTIYRKADDCFIIYADSGDKENLLKVLRQYIVADQVTTKVLSDQYFLVHASNKILSEIPSFLRIQRRRGFDDFSDLLIETAYFSPDNFRRWNEAVAEEYRYHRILNHIPSFPEEMNEETLFSEARFTDGFAINKGCYVGQEVVEKIDTVGKTPRVLRVINFQAPLGETRELRNEGGETIGQIVTTATFNDKTVSFARIAAAKSAVDMKVLCDSVEGQIIW